MTENKEKNNYCEKNWKLVNFCEFDKYATNSYCAIHNEDGSKNLGDITKVDETKLEPFNMICGGSPCQDFSVAGKQKGSVILKEKEPVFFIAFNEVEQYEYKLNIAKYYDLKIIVSRNDVETSILKTMKESDNVLHISELKEDVVVKGYLSNTELSNQESRAMMLFDMISRILGFDHNVFSIGDLMVTKSIAIEVLNVDEELVESDIVALKDSLNKKVYIDRSILNKNHLREDINENLDVKDYQFIMANFKQLMKEVSLIADMNEDECEEKVLNILGNCA